jgi:sucrose-6-phosphate hydrolase
MTYEESLLRANRSVAEAHQEVAKGSYRLAYHIMAPAYWINDPNGLIQFKGEYHAFYQHHPYGPAWGPMYWGHVKSKDLVHWEHLPIALAPGDDYDRDGCYSGSAVDDNGTLTLIYTGNARLGEAKTPRKQVQCIATSIDGITFTKDPANPVISQPPKDGEGTDDFRDPKVWKHGDSWYMMAGTQKEKKGKVVIYTSKDLHAWHYLGVAAESDGSLGYMWECPDLFPLGEQDVLLLSPQGMTPQGDLYQNLYQTGYLVGKFDYATGKFTYGAQGSFEELDKGFDFYAAQTFLDDKGRRILIGWMDMWESPMPTQAQGWAGAMTLPRELTLDERGKIIMQPVPELQALRDKQYHFAPYTLTPQQQDAEGLQGDRLEMIVEFSLNDCSASAFGIKVRCSADGQESTVITYGVEQDIVSVARNHSGQGVNGIRRAHLNSTAKSHVKFHVFIDRSSLEIFVNDGELVFSNRIYPDPASTGIHVFTQQGSVQINAYDAWELQDIWTTPHM